MFSLRPIISWFTVLAASALAIASFPNVASACSCAAPEHFAPSITEKNVPTNTKIWTTTFGCTEPVLQKQGGATVPVTVTQIENVTVIQPSSELELGSTYEVTNCGFFAEKPIFTVTEGPDTTPPPVPTYTLGDTTASGSSFSSCGEDLYVPLEVKFNDTLLVLDIAGRSTLDVQKLNGDIADAFFRDDNPLVGNSTCATFNWNFDEDGDAANVRLGAFDLAGNFSGMTPAQTVEAGCTCSTAGASSTNGHGPVFAALALVGISRMRKKTRP